jgi:hypothetical protein
VKVTRHAFKVIDTVQTDSVAPVEVNWILNPGLRKIELDDGQVNIEVDRASSIRVQSDATILLSNCHVSQTYGHLEKGEKMQMELTSLDDKSMLAATTFTVVPR